VCQASSQYTGRGIKKENFIIIIIIIINEKGICYGVLLLLLR